MPVSLVKYYLLSALYCMFIIEAPSLRKLYSTIQIATKTIAHFTHLRRRLAVVSKSKLMLALTIKRAIVFVRGVEYTVLLRKWIKIVNYYYGLYEEI